MTRDPNLWRTTRPLLPVLLTLLLLSGCSTWDNVSAYFNTYYNAAKLYAEAETEVWALPELKSAGGDPLVPFTVPGGAKTKFTSVIEKCSKLLQYHPESGLVDNCLMMIGMSYFYQADYQRAERKFVELLETYPDGEYAMEARLMLARTAFKKKERQRAKELSTELLTLAEEEGEDEIVAHAAGILGRLAYEDGQYDAARSYFETMAEGAGNADLRSSAYLRVATIDSVLADYEAALKAYTKAEGSAANVSAEYKGAIGAARMESFLGDYGDALDRLEDMGTNSNFRESFGEIALEVGHVLRRSGDLDRAIEQYRFVDTAFVRSEASGSALYALGQIYETQLYDFDSARVMYNKARTALPVTSILSPPVVRRADAMNKWWTFRAEITRYDSILVYMDSVDAARKNAPPPDTTSAKDSTAASDTTKTRADSLKAPAPVPVPPPQGLPRDTVESRLAASMTELATLHFLTLETLDSASVWYSRVLNEYPESRGAPRAMFALAEMSARDTVNGAERADSLRHALIERYPDSEFAAVARRILGLAPVESRSDTSGRMYAQAEALYLSGRNEEAIAGFQEIIDRFPNSNDAARSQFAIGFIYENYVGLNDSAEVHYRSLVKTFPRTPYATTIQPRLLEIDQARKEMEAARRRDSVAAAKTARLPGGGAESPGFACGAQGSAGGHNEGGNRHPQSSAADNRPHTRDAARHDGSTARRAASVRTAPSEPPSEPPQGEPPKDQPPSEPPPDQVPPPSPPDIIRPGYR